jgi:ASC-1-like (ASCH) protein
LPTFRTKKPIYEWIKSGQKTIELRRGKSIDGDSITFLSGRGEKTKGRILGRHEGKLEDLLNHVTYSKIVPPAKSFDEALAFIKKIYPFTEGIFTTYEFQLNEE